MVDVLETFKQYTNKLEQQADAVAVSTASEDIRSGAQVNNSIFSLAQTAIQDSIMGYQAYSSTEAFKKATSDAIEIKNNIQYAGKKLLNPKFVEQLTGEINSRFDQIQSTFPFSNKQELDNAKLKTFEFLKNQTAAVRNDEVRSNSSEMLSLGGRTGKEYDSYLNSKDGKTNTSNLIDSAGEIVAKRFIKEQQDRAFNLDVTNPQVPIESLIKQGASLGYNESAIRTRRRNINRSYIISPSQVDLNTVFSNNSPENLGPQELIKSMYSPEGFNIDIGTNKYIQSIKSDPSLTESQKEIAIGNANSYREKIQSYIDKKVDPYSLAIQMGFPIGEDLSSNLLSGIDKLSADRVEFAKRNNISVPITSYQYQTIKNQTVDERDNVISVMRQLETVNENKKMYDKTVVAISNKLPNNLSTREYFNETVTNSEYSALVAELKEARKQIPGERVTVGFNNLDWGDRSVAYPYFTASKEDVKTGTNTGAILKDLYTLELYRQQEGKSSGDITISSLLKNSNLVLIKADTSLNIVPALPNQLSSFDGSPFISYNSAQIQDAVRSQTDVLYSDLETAYSKTKGIQRYLDGLHLPLIGSQYNLKVLPTGNALIVDRHGKQFINPYTGTGVIVPTQKLLTGSTQDNLSIPYPLYRR